MKYDLLLSVMNQDYYYVLGWEQPSGKVAILCRSRGNNPGPAYCWTKREAIQLRTRLANDRRGEQNPSARRIIRQLLVYRYLVHHPLLWRQGDLWVYADPSELEPVEATAATHGY
ncbi:hypothetical protein BH11CYA1_BH11CYA1_40550 [soil metagenome]